MARDLFAELDGPRSGPRDLFAELDAPAQPKTYDFEALTGAPRGTLVDRNAPPPPPPTKAPVVPPKPGGSKYLTFGNAILAGLDDLDKLGGSAQEAIGEWLGSEKLAEYGREARETNTREAAEYGEGGKFSDIASVGDAFRWANQTAGRLIPVMVPSVAGGIAGAAAAPAVGVTATVGAAAGAFIPSWGLGVGEVQAAMKEKDPTKEADAWVFAGGTAIAALDSVLPGAVGGKLIRTFGKEAAEEIALRTLMRPAPAALIGGAKAGAKGAAAEGVTESLQESIGEVSASFAAEQDVDWESLPERMLEAGAAGALMGGGISAPSGAAVGYQEARTGRVAAAPTPPA